MKNQNGFTMIELIIGLVMVMTVGMIVISAISGKGNDLSLGINGLSETRCIGGYKFIIGEGGQARQILNEQGGGIHCQ